jgi:DnaD/phage-associated family protein
MKNSSEVQSFSIYREYYDLITLVSKQERAELLLAISEYMFEGIEPELNDNQMKIFSNLKRPLDKSKNKSKNSTKQNQNKIKMKTKQNQNENDNNNKTKTHQDVNVVVNNTLNNKNNSISIDNNTNSILDFVEKNYGRSLTPYEFEEVNSLVNTHTEPIVLKAYKVAFEQGHNKLSYIKGVLKAWKDCGLDSLEKIEEDLKKGKKSETKLDAIFARARAIRKERGEES